MLSATMDPLAPLRYTTSLLSDTTDLFLPSQIPAIASLLYSSPVLDCALGPDAAQPRRTQEDAAVTTNKFKTQVSALLQSKSPQIRWCGAVLVKCSVESSFQALVAWGPAWTRLLVPLISRPEPTAIHVMVIRTLTRIFTDLTAGKPNLTREIVTPHLPTVLTGLVNLISTSMDDSEPEVLATSLEALRDLLRAHSVTTRPFATRIRVIVLRLLQSDSRNDIEQLGRELFVALHFCASSSSRGPSMANVDNLGGGKANVSALEWTGSFTAVVDETHDVLDRLLEPIVEEYGNGRSSSMVPNHARTGGQEEATTKLGLKEWNGLVDGIKRLRLLVHLLQTFLSSPTSTQVSIHFGRVVDLVTRILAVSTSSQPNTAIETSQREALLSIFPGAQAETVGLLDCAVQRLGKSLTPFISSMLGQIAYLFTDQLWSASVKTAVYIVLSSLLSEFGPGLGKESTTSIYAILNTATADLLPSRIPDTIQKPMGKKKNGKIPIAHADSFLTQTSDVFRLPGIVAAANLLLSTAMSRVPANYIPSELRTRMDRAAVVCGNEKALLAGVLFPPPKAKASLIPHLVGAGTSLEVEALIRPRLPIVWTGSRRKVEEEEEAQDESMDTSGLDEAWRDDYQDEGNASKRIRLDSTVEERSAFQPAVFLQPTAPKLDHVEKPAAPATTISPLKLPTIPVVPTALDHGLPTSSNGNHARNTFLSPSNIDGVAGISPVKPTLSSTADAEHHERVDLTRSSFTQERIIETGGTVTKETTEKETQVRHIGQDDVSGNESGDDEIPEVDMGESSSEDEDDE